MDEGIAIFGGDDQLCFDDPEETYATDLHQASCITDGYVEESWAVLKNLVVQDKVLQVI